MEQLKSSIQNFNFQEKEKEKEKEKEFNDSFNQKGNKNQAGFFMHSKYKHTHITKFKYKTKKKIDNRISN